MKKCIVIVFCIILHLTTSAQDLLFWTGDGDGITWEDLDNWEDIFLTKRTPLATDLVEITVDLQRRTKEDFRINTKQL
ncbi:MAG: hypothetical protein V3V00_06605 [Saprospiraceae bacterium]